MSNTSTAPRVGLIGFGTAGRFFHAPLLASTPGLELAAVVTSDPARRDDILATYPGTRVVATAEELWTLNLDLVVVASPNKTHVPLAEAAWKQAPRSSSTNRSRSRRRTAVRWSPR